MRSEVLRIATEVSLRLAREAGFRDDSAARALRNFAKVLPKLSPETLTDAGEIAMYWSDLTLFASKAKRRKGLITVAEERAEEKISGALAWLGGTLIESDYERTPVRILLDAESARWR